jgi:uncharacterized protein involved in exopolysaccharide biosynthesis
MKGKFASSGFDFENHSHNQGGHNRADPVEPEVNLFALTGLFVKRKKWIGTTVGSVVIIATVILLLLPNKYTSTATILPSGTPDTMSKLKELTGLGQFGLKNGDESELFPVILRSNLIRDAVLNREYSFVHQSKPMTLTLAEYFGGDNPDKLRKALSSITSIKMDKKTGVINIEVETKHPEFSLAILNRYLAELEAFNLHKRRSRAKDKGQYLARQIQEIEVEMEQTEDRLQHFQQVNRDWASSSDPEIVKMLSRLQRDIVLKSKIYLFLSQEYEIAKLDAQKDVPIVKILDPPSLPAIKSSPKRAVLLAVCCIVALFTTLFFVVVFEMLKKRSAGADRESYDVLREDFQKSFPRVVRLIRKRKQPEVIGG